MKELHKKLKESKLNYYESLTISFIAIGILSFSITPLLLAGMTAYLNTED